jgi:hypothetical protein
MPKQHGIKMCGYVEEKLLAFQTSLLDWDECPASHFDLFIPNHRAPLPTEQNIVLAPNPIWTQRLREKSRFSRESKPMPSTLFSEIYKTNVTDLNTRTIIRCLYFLATGRWNPSSPFSRKCMFNRVEGQICRQLWHRWRTSASRKNCYTGRSIA